MNDPLGLCFGGGWSCMTGMKLYLMMVWLDYRGSLPAKLRGAPGAEIIDMECNTWDETRKESSNIKLSQTPRLARLLHTDQADTPSPLRRRSPTILISTTQNKLEPKLVLQSGPFVLPYRVTWVSELL